MRLQFAIVILATVLPIYGQEKSPQSAPNKNYANDVKKREPQTAPASPTPQVNVINQQASAAQEYGAKNHADSYLRRLFSPENLPSIGLLIAGIAGIVVAICTLKIIERQTGHIARQARSMRYQTTILRNSAEATRKAAEATEKSVETLIMKERARIRIEVGQLEIRPPDDEFAVHAVSYKVFCYGTTPAFPLDSRATLIVADSKEPANKTFPIPMSLPSVINPAADGIKKHALLFDTLQENGFDRIRKGELFPQFYGSIKYRDVFDREREYRFRYVWTLSPWRTLPSSEPAKLEDLGSWSKCGPESDNSET